MFPQNEYKRKLTMIFPVDNAGLRKRLVEITAVKAGQETPASFKCRKAIYRVKIDSKIAATVVSE
jgi:hypothetical protein